MISEPLKSVLARAGGSPRRTIDAASTIQRLQEHGYTVHNAASEVIAGFGGLTLDIREIVSSNGDTITPMFPATVHIIDETERFQLPPWANCLRGDEPADQRFLRWKYGWNACYVGFLDRMYWGGPSGAALYGLATGESVLVDASWSNLYLHPTFVDLLDSLVHGGHIPDRERILDADEPANRELSRLQLFDGWQPFIQPTLWQRVRRALSSSQANRE
jgi:hypothetical protein